MTRANALTVVLDTDHSAEQTQAIITAIRMFRGVLSVDPEVACVGDHVALMRLRHEMAKYPAPEFGERVAGAVALEGLKI